MLWYNSDTFSIPQFIRNTKDFPSATELEYFHYFDRHSTGLALESEWFDGVDSSDISALFPWGEASPPIP